MRYLCDFFFGNFHGIFRSRERGFQIPGILARNGRGHLLFFPSHHYPKQFEMCCSLCNGSIKIRFSGLNFNFPQTAEVAWKAREVIIANLHKYYQSLGLNGLDAVNRVSNLLLLLPKIQVWHLSNLLNIISN